MKSSLHWPITKLIFKSSWPRMSEVGDEVLLIYDQVLPKVSSGFARWIRSAPLQYSVKAGESLKDIQHFSEHIKKITKLTEGTSVRGLTICVVGGGSVGDFGGFVASVLKRGVRLVHIPSTWLAALDSAHGGKTALNVGGAKNQIGTFYPAEKTFLIRDLLLSQPESRVDEGFAEIVKVALLQGGSFWKQIAQEEKLDANLLWHYLPDAIEAKMKIVKQDPLEKSGHRHLLNFGHTVGHVLESLYQLPHGLAVNYGLDFALRWSVRQGFLKQGSLSSTPLATHLLSLQKDNLILRSNRHKQEFLRLLASDKKKTQAKKVRFIFLQKPGRAVIREVLIEDIWQELVRQSEMDPHGY